MGEKTTVRFESSLRSLSGLRYYRGSLFRTSHFKRGFTLVELLIVIAILGILAVLLVTVLDPFGQIQKSRDAQRKQDLSQLQRTLEAYYNDNGSYPPSNGASNFQITPATGALVWGSTWTAYNTKLPKDPDSNRRYVYITSNSNQTYYIFTSLERGANDSQVCYPGTNNPCGKVASQYPNQCGISDNRVCNYGVTSPNSSPNLTL